MEFVKLKTRYYLDVAILRAGEPAEVLFTRSLAYCGDQETDGFIPRQAVAQITPTRARARVSALVREGLWEPVDGGWVIAGWVKHQITTERLEQKREAGRQRVAAHRARQARNAPGNAVTNSERCSTEVRGKREETAAAAADSPPLPPALEILKGKLDAARMTVRWDRLTADQHTEIEALIGLHGDGPLVRAAVAAYRPNSPAAFAQAWLGHWRDLPAPGAGLQLVRTRCTTHPEIQLDAAGTCRSCAADQKAAR